MTSPPSKDLPLFPFPTTHAHLIRINKLLTHPPSLDKTLCTLNYTLRLLSSLLPRLFPHPHPHPTSLKPPTTLPPSLLRLLPRIRALTALIDDHRIFTRLTALPSLLLSTHSTLTNPPTDFVSRQIAYFQIAVDLAYQVLENGAYLASKGVLRWTRRREDRAWLWSSRCWAGSVGAEILRLLYLASASRQEKGGRGIGEGGEVEEGEEEKRRRREDETWWRAMATNLAWLPLTVHWSVEGGLFGEGVVGALGVYAGGLELREMWRNTV